MGKGKRQLKLIAIMRSNAWIITGIFHTFTTGIVYLGKPSLLDDSDDRGGLIVTDHHTLLGATSSIFKFESTFLN